MLFSLKNIMISVKIIIVVLVLILLFIIFPSLPLNLGIKIKPKQLYRFLPDFLFLVQIRSWPKLIIYMTFFIRIPIIRVTISKLKPVIGGFLFRKLLCLYKLMPHISIIARVDMVVVLVRMHMSIMIYLHVVVLSVSV